MRQLSAIILVWLALHAVRADAATHNVLFILTDDQGWATLGCYGGQYAETPNLDRLAAQGVRFTDAYVTPQCTPTRAALLTGQHTARNGMWHVIPYYGYPWAPMTEPAYVESLPRETFTIGKGFQQAGYKTAIIGKWHLTHGEDGYYPAMNPKAGQHFGFDHVPAESPKSTFEPGGDRGVADLTDKAVRFITEQSESRQPWFCYLSHHMIHGVVVAPSDLTQKYRDRGFPEEGLFNATYLAGLESIDQSVGRLMTTLNRLNVAENTIVVFLSDNGGVAHRFDRTRFDEPTDLSPKLSIARYAYDNAPLRAGKGSPYEGGIRVPCIVRWPGEATAGLTCSTPVHITDWLPTLLAAAGATSPSDHVVDGIDLRPLFKGGEVAPRDILFHMPLYDSLWESTPCAVLRRGDDKIIHYFGDWFDRDHRLQIGSRTELYNLHEDLGEEFDLAKAEPEKTAKMRTALLQQLTEIGVDFPKKNANHDPRRALMFSKQRIKTP